MFAALTGLLAIAPILVDHYVVTDRERVTQNVRDVVRAFEAGDADRTLAFFSSQAECERLIANAALIVITVKAPLSIKDVGVDLEKDGTVAVSRFRVNGEVLIRGQSIGHQATLWRVMWRKEGGDWRIARLQQLDPISGERTNHVSAIGAKVCE